MMQARRFRQIALFAILLFPILMMQPDGAQWVKQASFRLLSGSHSVAGLRQYGETIAHEVDVPAYEIFTDNEGYDHVRIDGFPTYARPGDPLLPAKVLQLALPPDVDMSSVRVEVSAQQSTSVALDHDLRPAAPYATWYQGQQQLDWGDNATTIEDGRNRAVYESTTGFPGTYGKLEGPGKMRKWRFIRIQLFPIQYQPTTRELHIAQKLDVRVQFDRLAAAAETAQTELSDSVFDVVALRRLANFSEMRQLYSAAVDPVSQTTPQLAIVTTSQVVDQSQMLAAFVAHKVSCGYNVQIVTESDFGILAGQHPNGTSEKIRQWLIDHYLLDTIKYALLIGDPTPETGGVPMKMCWPRFDESTSRNVPTDYYYADLTGNWDLDGDGYFCEYNDDRGWGGVDFTPEIYVGRIPVYPADGNWVADLDHILQKIIDYELESDQAWRLSALLPMSFSDDSTDGAYLGEHMKHGYLEATGYDTYTMYQQMTGTACDSSFASDTPLTDRNVRAEWSTDPKGLVAWWAHGSSAGAGLNCGGGTLFDVSDVPYLDDAHPALTFQASCTNGYPESASNLAYSLLKHGAIETVAGSRVTYYRPGRWYPSSDPMNATIGYGFLQGVAGLSSFGDALFEAKTALWMEDMFGWFNFMSLNSYGDPSTRLMEDTDIAITPEVLDVTVVPGETETVNLRIENIGGKPLRYRLEEAEHSHRVAIYNHFTTTDVSYWHGGDATSAGYLYGSVLETDPEERFDITYVSDLSSDTLASFNRLVLPDTGVPDEYLQDVDDWFSPGKRIVVMDDAVGFAAHTGYLWPDGAGSHGHGVLWDSGSGWEQEVIATDKLTEDYVIGNRIYADGGCARLYRTQLSPDAHALTVDSSDQGMVYVAYREVPHHGTIVALGPFESVPWGWRLESVEALIRDAVAGPSELYWLAATPMAGEIAEGGAADIMVLLDASAPSVTYLTTYEGALFIAANDREAPTTVVPVTMRVSVPPTWGQIAGTVRTLGYCDAQSQVLPGATVKAIAEDETVLWQSVTDAEGGYTVWVDAQIGSITLTVEADDHVAASQSGISVDAGGAVNLDFDLRVHRPCLSFLPDTSPEATVILRHSEQITLTLTNRGAGPADIAIYELGAVEARSSVLDQDQGHVQVAEGEKPPSAMSQPLRDTSPSLRTVGVSGGPDAFGYTFDDSYSQQGPDYLWIEIAPPEGGSGHKLVKLTGVDDGYYWPLMLPFDFPFYGETYRDVAVGSNGAIYFEDRYLGYDFHTLPGSSTESVERLVAPYWKDLVVRPGAIYYEHVGPLFIIEYYQLSEFGDDTQDSGSWQLILQANGNMWFQYKDAAIGSQSGVIGIQNDPNIGLQYGTGTDLADGLAICFAYPGQPRDCAFEEDIGWLTTDPISTTIAPDDSTGITMTLSADPMLVTPSEEYVGELLFVTNDFDHRQVSVPVSMRVVEYAFRFEAETAQCAMPGERAEYRATIANLSTDADIYELLLVAAPRWEVEIPVEVGPVAVGESVQFTVAVSVPYTAQVGESEQTDLRIRSQADGNQAIDWRLTTTVESQWYYLPIVRNGPTR